MSNVIATILGLVSVGVAATYVIFTLVRARNDRRRDERLSIAFDRAHSIRTRGIGFQGTHYSVYAELDCPYRRGE